MYVAISSRIVRLAVSPDCPIVDPSQKRRITITLSRRLIAAGARNQSSTCGTVSERATRNFIPPLRATPADCGARRDDAPPTLGPLRAFSRRARISRLVRRLVTWYLGARNLNIRWTMDNHVLYLAMHVFRQITESLSARVHFSVPICTFVALLTILISGRLTNDLTRSREFRKLVN